MTALKQWLNANPSMSTRLADELDVKPATISNVKHGRRPLPTRWIPTIVALSGNLLTYQSLVLERNRTQGAT